MWQVLKAVTIIFKICQGLQRKKISFLFLKPKSKNSKKIILRFLQGKTKNVEPFKENIFHMQ